jgi:hypothetical protein
MAFFGVGVNVDEPNRTKNWIALYLGMVLCSISVIFWARKNSQNRVWPVRPSVNNIFPGREYDSADSQGQTKRF